MNRQVKEQKKLLNLPWNKEIIVEGALLDALSNPYAHSQEQEDFCTASAETAQLIELFMVIILYKKSYYSF